MPIMLHLLHPPTTTLTLTCYTDTVSPFTPHVHKADASADVPCTHFKNNLYALSRATHALCCTHELHTRTHMLTDASCALPTHSAAHHTLHTHLSTLALHKPTEHCTSTLVSLCRTRICQHSRNLHCHVHCYTQTAFCLALVSLRFIHAHSLLR